MLGCESGGSSAAFAGLAMPRKAACALTMSCYAPYHHRTGVRYHALFECVDGPPPPSRCTGPPPTDNKRDKRAKYSWEKDVPLSRALLGRIRSVLGGNSSTSLLAPYEFECRAPTGD